MKERYKVCTSCETIHLIHHSFKDKSPTCFKCGLSSFEDLKNTAGVDMSFTPVFCDWRLQHNIDVAAESLLDIILEKNQESLNADLKSDLKHYFVFAANSNRRGFINSMRSFTDYMRAMSNA